MAGKAALLELRRVTVVRGATVVLRRFDLRIGVGEHVAILGPNGCGKSTLLKTLTRECYPLLEPDSYVAILGRRQWDLLQLRGRLGIVSNDLQAHWTEAVTGREVVLSGFFGSIGLWGWADRVTPAMAARADAALARLDAAHLADRPITEMSSGEARRTLIARALVHDPLALVFDEPSTSLDLAGQRELRAILGRLAGEGVGIVLVTHHPTDIVPEIERVVLMREGQVVADGPKVELLTARRLGELFGVPVQVNRQDGLYHVW